VVVDGKGNDIPNDDSSDSNLDSDMGESIDRVTWPRSRLQ